MAIHNVNNLMNNPAGKVTTGTAAQSGPANNRAEVEVQAKNQPHQVAVSLTDQAQALNKLQQKIKDAPLTNQSKVESLKAAIEKGEYKVDSQRTAQKMIAIESDLESLYK